MVKKFNSSFLILLIFIVKKSYSHYDEAYFRSTNDPFRQNPNWMDNIRDDVQLSEMALPGTHDTGAFFPNPTNDIAATQTMNYRQQLDNGIRVFDIRVVQQDNRFEIYHGILFLDSNFDDVMNNIRDFLNENPSETVLLRVRKEIEGSDNTRSLRDTMQDYLNRYSDKWLNTQNMGVTLGEARNKFIILSDNDQFNDFGLPYPNFNIQDNFQLGTNWDLHNGKWESIKNQLSNAIGGDREQFYVNYLSGSGGSFPYFVASGHSSPGTSAPRLATGLTTPGFSSSYPDFPRVDCLFTLCTIAFEGTNILTRDRIQSYNGQMERNEENIARTIGIIYSDFPGSSLIEAIINNNLRLRK